MNKKDLIKINDITYQDLSKVSIRELRKLSNSMIKDIDKNYDKWIEYYNKHTNTPLAPSFIHDGKVTMEDILNKTKLNKILEEKIDARNKSQVYDRFKKLRDFINQETYEIKDFKKYTKSVRERLTSLTKSKIKYTRRFSEIFWDAYNKLTGHGDETESYDKTKLAKISGSSLYDSNNFQSKLYDIYVQNKDIINNEQDLVDIILERMNELKAEEKKVDTLEEFGFR